MKITDISLQARNQNRVNISVDGAYRLSLDITQVTDLGVKIGKEYTASELVELETESQFGKVYANALEYSVMRPRSEKEVRDYLWRKTRTTRYKSRNGEIKERAGVSESVTERVLKRLIERGYVDDTVFAKWWVENRNQRKGSSKRKLENELMTKGVSRSIIEQAVGGSTRSDTDELQKVIAKKQPRYSDPMKFKQYLVRQGFTYDDINKALSDDYDDSM